MALRTLAIFVFSLILLLGGSFAGSSNRSFLERNKKVELPNGWVESSRCNPDEPIQLYLALSQSNLGELDSLFEAVSDPLSPLYGRYLTDEELGHLIAPSQRTVDTVTGWLSAHGMDKVEFTRYREFVKVHTTVKHAEELLGGIEYRFYVHTQSKITIKRSVLPYSVPSNLKEHIDFVGGVHHFPKVQSIKAKRMEARDSFVDPNVVKQAFNISDTVGKSADNSQAVSQFLGQFYDPADLTSFQKSFNLPVEPVAKLLGPNDPSNPGDEAELDIQYIMGVANHVPTWFISTPGLHEGQEPFLEWMINLNNISNVPLVHSVSYGDVESSISLAYVNRVDQEFKKFGLKGKSILFASGDDGVGCNDAGTKFEPNWPATSAYVTAVGGTILSSQSPLRIVSDSISSGGFSNYFAQPAYQKKAVSGYLSQGQLPAQGYYNTTGRAFPDVSAFSENVVIVVGGGQTYVGGTSCAAPMFSAVISLINDERLQKGKPVVGFLNKQLYLISEQYPAALLDVTRGDDNGSGFDCSPGFSPSAGWDPVTGLGVPNYPELSKAFDALTSKK